MADAIIATLAALLFTVFAGTKEGARGCVFNPNSGMNPPDGDRNLSPGSPTPIYWRNYR